ncbi:MAG: OmpA family protein [Cytophagaceae bacterium]
MRFSKILLFSFLFSIMHLTVSAQSEKRFLKEAEDCYKNGDKKNALSNYLKAYERNPDNITTNFMIGKLYLEIGKYQPRSLKYLEKAFASKPTIDKDIHKLLGQSYHYNHQFDKAIENYEKYKTTLKPGDPLIAKIDRKIYECKNGKEFLADPVEAKIENVGPTINTAFAEYAPVISADESTLIFTSRREGSTGALLDETGEYFEDIYISRKVNGKWSTPQNIGNNINTPGHDASIGLSADGRELFIYKDDQGGGDIFYCRLKKDSTWSKPIPMEGHVNTKKYYENSACISADGKRLYFASDRDGGFGGMDLWVVEMDNKGNWGKPVNLGKEINTEADEEGPFLDFDGKTLYFSSQLHKGMGGYDIFKSVFDFKTKTWSTPQNLGYPINSADNDIYFVLSGDGRHGYFSSIKEEGYGEKDIYMITMPPREDYEELVTKLEAFKKKTLVEIKEDKIEPPKEEPKPEIVLVPVILKGKVFEANSGQPLSATVQLIDDKGKVIEELVTGSDGSYQFTTTGKSERKFTISTQKDGFGFSSKSVKVPADGPKEQELINDLNLKKLEVGTKIILRNIYFDFDKATLKQISYTELGKLHKLLSDNPSMKVEIAGHTDSKGSNEYNKVLSQKRAEAVVNYLVSKGIERSRMIPKGYGEERPLASNDDEDEGRELNRRTEFEILKQ